MKRMGITSDRMIALFLLGAVAFNVPLLAVANVDAFVFGVPVLYVYLFAAWGGLIALMAATTKRPNETAAPPRPLEREEN